MSPSGLSGNTPSPLAGEGWGEGAAVDAPTARANLSPPTPLPQGERGAVTQATFVKHLRQHMTDSEIGLWRHLRAHRLNGEKFRRQQQIGPYVVDFVHFGARLIVEADGGQHNGAAADERRDAWLRAQGFTVMRFWNNEIMQNLAGVLETIMAAVSELSVQAAAPARTPSPPPLSREGRGEQSTGIPGTGGARISPSPLAGEGLGRGEITEAATKAHQRAKDSS